MQEAVEAFQIYLALVELVEEAASLREVVEEPVDHQRQAFRQAYLVPVVAKEELPLVGLEVQEVVALEAVDPPVPWQVLMALEQEEESPLEGRPEPWEQVAPLVPEPSRLVLEASQGLAVPSTLVGQPLQLLQVPSTPEPLSLQAPPESWMPALQPFM